MRKRLIRKLFMLVVLCAALTAVSVAPASARRGGVLCVDAPMDSGCWAFIAATNGAAGGAREVKIERQRLS